MKHYETIYILNPNLTDEDYREIINKINSLIENHKGVIVKTEEWGKQRLAYSIKKFYNGFYVLVDFCGGPGLPAEPGRNLKIDERILKYQTIKLADNVDPQELILKEKEGPKEIKENVADTDQDMEEEHEVGSDEETVEESEVISALKGLISPSPVPLRPLKSCLKA